MVKSKKYGIINALAFCDVCNWTDGINIQEPNRMQKLRNRIYIHVRETHHKVILETGNSTDYFLT